MPRVRSQTSIDRSSILPKEQSLEFERIVSQTKARRLRQKSLQTTDSSQNLSGLQIEKASVETTPPSVVCDEIATSQSSHVIQRNIQFQVNEMDFSTFDNWLWDSVFDDTVSSVPLSSLAAINLHLNSHLTFPISTSH